MKSPAVAAFVAGFALLAAGVVTAADAVPAASAAASTPPGWELLLDTSPTAKVAGGEPAVQHTVIDDKTAHIDELRVRGQLQNVTVRPKGKLPEYEVLTGSNARDLPEQGINRSSGLEGKRVWSLLRF